MVDSTTRTTGVEAYIRYNYVMWLTADLIAQTPYGYRARLAEPGKPSAYADGARRWRFMFPQRAMVAVDV